MKYFVFWGSAECGATTPDLPAQTPNVLVQSQVNMQYSGDIVLSWDRNALH